MANVDVFSGAYGTLIDDVSCESFLAQPGYKCVFFSARWSAPDRMVAPHFKTVAEKYSRLMKFAVVDIDDSVQTVTRFNIQSIPTFIVFKNAVPVDQIIGAVPEHVLSQMIQKHLASPPAQGPAPQVRQEAAAQKARKIFISYRRDDSADVTGRIGDRLKARFGAARIFHDVHSIPLGVDFHEYIADQLKECGVVLAVIGRDWLNSVDEHGDLRIHGENDFVRLEISYAFQKSIPVIPLLLDRASIPRKQDLPDDLARLVRQNGIRVRPDPDFDRDMEQLALGIERLL